MPTLPEPVFTVYRTTCLVNGKIYIGVHKTRDPNDAYIGSGNLISLAVKKYGRDQFRKEVLFIFETRVEAYAKEKGLVTAAFAKRTDTYNLRPGGDGGWGYVAQNRTAEEWKRISLRAAEARKRLWEDPEWAAQRRAQNTKHLQNVWKGRKHSEETKAKMKTTMADRGTHRGEKNSQHGTAWICKLGEKSRKIPKAELPEWKAQGWVRGRKIKPPRTPKPKSSHECGSCETRFPTWVEVDGKWRNVGGRDHCVSCWPLGTPRPKVSPTSQGT